MPVAALNASNPEAEGDAACVLRDVAFSLGGDRSGGYTGGRSMNLRFTNNGEQTCVLDGPPAVAFLDSNAHPMLREDENGAGRQYVHSTGSAAIRLQSGSSAEVVIAKYRCDLGDEAVASQVRIGLPGAADTTTSVIDPEVVGGMSSCRGGDEDPGQTFAISGYSPFVCHVVGNATGGGWCDGDLDRQFTQTPEEAARAAQKDELARRHSQAKSG